MSGSAITKAPAPLPCAHRLSAAEVRTFRAVTGKAPRFCEMPGEQRTCRHPQTGLPITVAVCPIHRDLPQYRAVLLQEKP